MDNWYALYVKSRHEFVTRGELVKKGIETFLPVARKLRQWRDRKKWIEFPVFPGYLFIHIPNRPDAFLAILKTRGAIQIISQEPGFPTPVPSEEIESLRLLVESGQTFDVYPDLKEGTRVRVRRGPLRGATGIVQGKEDHYLLLVNIDLLGRSVGVKIFAEDVEAD